MEFDDLDITALWAKSNASGRSHSLIGHLLDTTAVAELVWDEFMAPSFRRVVGESLGGEARDVFRLICALHDIGKCTPAFQVKDPALAVAAIEGGWSFQLGLSAPARAWHHGAAGAVIVREWLACRAATGLDWIVPIIQGHHGRFDSAGTYRNAHWAGHPTSWASAQQRLADLVVARAQIPELTGGTPPPPRAVQHALAGFVVMADWIASSLPGLGHQDVDLSVARERARAAWATLRLGSGWRQLDAASHQERFGDQPRPLQTLVADLADSMSVPGLMIVEAPMGEGKTEAALIATERFAVRFGCDGLAFAMPTQGTTDAMYERVARWASQVDARVPVSLLHGKAMGNEKWRSAVQQARLADLYDTTPDTYGLPDGFGAQVPDGTPSSWMLGRHRQALAAVYTGTVDQVLMAATRTKFNMMRVAGLAGKTVVIDEVHAYDVYSSQFLHALLGWLGQLKVPVVLMSATLPPATRAELVAAYTGRIDDGRPEGYPVVTCAGAELRRQACPTWRPGLTVALEKMPGSADDIEALAERIEVECAGGGCVLVVVNTVRRSQDLFLALRNRGVPTRLLHGRFTVSERADRSAELLGLLGPQRTRASGRPERLVIVATQIAEQSFDVDADFLVSDLAPMDLLLQRIGRLHRHERPVLDRPPSMRQPRVLITGVVPGPGAIPVFPRSWTYVYAADLLLRTAFELGEARAWIVPDQVPELVARVYEGAHSLPEPWGAAVARAQAEREEREDGRRRLARGFLLDSTLTGHDLAGMHYQTAAGTELIVVRDGEPTLEAAVVVKAAQGYQLLDGTPLGAAGERGANDDIAGRVLRDTVRLRAREFSDLSWLPGWQGIPLLARLPALVLGEDRTAQIPGRSVRYDLDLGLIVEWGRR